MRKLLLALAIIAATGSALKKTYKNILEAAERGDTPAVINLIKRGMDVNTADQRGNSLSMIAARTGNVELIDFLLNSRAAVNRRNRFGDTAALLAAANGQIQALKLIHERGGQLEPARDLQPVQPGGSLARAIRGGSRDRAHRRPEADRDARRDDRGAERGTGPWK